MADNSRRRSVLIAIVVLAILLLLLLLLTRCPNPAPPSAASAPSAPAPAPQSPESAPPAATPPDSTVPEVLTAATLKAPDKVPAGAAFTVEWTGPANRGDYVTIVRAESPPETPGHYGETERGPSLELTAPMETGPYEIRYVTGRSRTILARAVIEVEPVTAAIQAPEEVVLGSEFAVQWTGPNNEGDYVTIVAKDAPDAAYASYAETRAGASLKLTAPTITGDAEVRYVSGQGRQVLARRPIRVIDAQVSLAAPDQAVAGTTIDATWTGPDNAGDYLTIVPAETPDGQYGNYANTSGGSPLKLLTPIMDGAAELRYMTGQGNRVLARRPIRIIAAEVRLSAPPRAAAGAPVAVTWTGPNNPGDYITIVAKATPDGQYGPYANTTGGSPLQVNAPAQPGEAEIRYMTGQGNKVLARIAITIDP